MLHPTLSPAELSLDSCLPAADAQFLRTSCSIATRNDDIEQRMEKLMETLKSKRRPRNWYTWMSEYFTRYKIRLLRFMRFVRSGVILLFSQISNSLNKCTFSEKRRPAERLNRNDQRVLGVKRRLWAGPRSSRKRSRAGRSVLSAPGYLSNPKRDIEIRSRRGCVDGSPAFSRGGKKANGLYSPRSMS